MSGGRSSGLVAVVLAAAGACAPGALDPVGTSTTEGAPNGGTSAGGSLTASIAALARPHTRMIIGSNAGAVIDTDEGTVAVFEATPDALEAAAAAAAMPVCSVELQRLVTASQAAGPGALTVEDALAECERFDFGYVRDQLAAGKLPSSLVLIGTNVGIRMGGSDRGFAYYYDEDAVRLLRAARTLYVPACIVVPQTLQVPMLPGGFTPGLSMEDALARCGRTVPRATP
jgi:hypothetical protein